MTTEQVDKIDAIPSNIDYSKLITTTEVDTKILTALDNAYGYTDSKKFASEAQGLKADQAIQEIVTDSNLSITSKADNKQTISINFGSVSTETSSLVAGVASAADVDAELVKLRARIKELEENPSTPTTTESSTIKVYTNNDCIFNMVPFDVDMSNDSVTFETIVCAEDDGSLEECGLNVSITRFTIDVPSGYSVKVMSKDANMNYTIENPMLKTQISKGVKAYNRYTNNANYVSTGNAQYQITITKD